jgi:hypothetical protein
VRPEPGDDVDRLIAVGGLAHDLEIAVGLEPVVQEVAGDR